MKLPDRTENPTPVALFLDLSPAGYIAFTQLISLWRSRRIALTLELLERSPISGESDLEDWAKRVGVKLQALHAASERVAPAAPAVVRACMLLRDRSGQEAVVDLLEQVFRRLWFDGCDLPAAIASAATANAVPADLIEQSERSPIASRLLQRAEHAAKEIGIDQLPAVIVGGTKYQGLQQIFNWVETVPR